MNSFSLATVVREVVERESAASDLHFSRDKRHQ